MRYQMDKEQHPERIKKKREQELAWRRKNGDKVKEYRVRNSKSSAESRAKWRINNKNKVLAENKLNRAVKHGLILRQPLCSVCFRETKTEAHHPDYGKPLDVIWLCRDCHVLLHGTT